MLCLCVRSTFLLSLSATASTASGGDSGYIAVLTAEFAGVRIILDAHFEKRRLWVPFASGFEDVQFCRCARRVGMYDLDGAALEPVENRLGQL
jgi:hypothetical protein